MLRKASFILITVFWVTMNVLLWRAEFGARNPAGNPVPVATVWKKILTAPDTSSMSILHRGERIGFCHWMTSVGEEFSNMEEAPEGMTGRVEQYRIVFEGNLTVTGWGTRLRFESVLQLSSNQEWEEFLIRLTARPQTIEFIANSQGKNLRVKGSDGERAFDRTYRFADLQNPETWIRELGEASPLALVQGFGLPALAQDASALDVGIRWEARETTLKIGHEPVRVYRLQTLLLDRYRVTIFVSRVGELLRVELPGEVELVHDSLINL